MDVILSEDQRMFQDATRRFLENRSPIHSLRQGVDNHQPYLSDVWEEGLELGWIALFVPEQHGGIAESASGVVDAAIVAEELGRVVYSGPFLPNSVAAFAIANAGSTEQQTAHLPSLASGATLASPCFVAPGPRAGIEPGGIRVARAADDFILDGTAAGVQDTGEDGYLLVTAVDADQAVSQFFIPSATPGVTLNAQKTLDLGRNLADVQFANVKVTEAMLLGPYGGGAAQFERQLQVALTLQSAETVGVTDRALEFTLDYVKQRYAFGRPIGSFQALKHRLASHAAQLEGAKAAVAHAAWAVQAQSADAAIAASVAKSQSGKYGTEIIRDCLQMHGGIGMTWEHDIHFYLRRAVSNEMLWGSPSIHYDRLCRLAQTGRES